MTWYFGEHRDFTYSRAIHLLF